MPSKPPTAQHISRLLAQAGFERAVQKVRGSSGFHVGKALGVPNGVLVNHWIPTHADTRKQERGWLQRYAEVIEKAGYRAEYDEGKCLLIVTARGTDR